MNCNTLRQLGLASLAVGLFSALPSSAQEYPSKSIKTIASFPLSTVPDTNTRHIAFDLSKLPRQLVVVENWPEAFAIVGLDAGAKASPDGYTLVRSSATLISDLPCTYATKAPYKAERCVVPGSVVDLLNPAPTARRRASEKNAKEIIEFFKKQPESVTAWTSGVGSYSHWAGERFVSNAGAKIAFVPHNTFSPYGDLVVGQVNVISETLPDEIADVRADMLKILALQGKARHSDYLEAPPFVEVGLPEDSPTAWVGFFAPAGQPAPLVAKLGVVLQKNAAQNPELIVNWRAFGGELKAQMPIELVALLKLDDALWGSAIPKTGTKLDS
jgi:tripartite-type tricarboxylate transporter receptor subunit TctC